MRQAKLLSSVLLLAICSFSCSLAASPECPEDPRFRDDIITPRWKFLFSPKHVPIKGEPVQASLDRLDPRGPATRWTFLQPFRFSLGPRSFWVDSLFHFDWDRIQEADGPNYYGYDLLEFMSLTLFGYRGATQDYYILHRIRALGSPNWRLGTYQSAPARLDQTFYPGAVEVDRRYWMQRTPYDRYRYIRGIDEADRAHLLELHKAGRLCIVTPEPTR